MREAQLERQDAFKVRHLLARKFDAQCLDVRLQMLDFATADDREDVRCLVHHVRDRDCTYISADAIR